VKRVALVLVVLAAGCAGDADGDRAAPVRFSPSDLPGMVLRAEEAPAGTEYIAASSGVLSLEDVWGSDCCPTQQEEFDDAGFAAAAGAFFEQPGHSGDPIDTRPGVEIASSTAVLFVTSTGAEAAMDSWFDYYRSPVLDPLDTSGLGEEAIAVTGSPDAPAEELFLYLWRIDRLVLSLRVSAGRGSVSLDEVRDWVDRMDARASA
jgi:hypothetical protein